ncbi:MAG: ABC transporter substrate binding protein [Rhodoferax sp.]|uniref:ABC transporter substrate-binding protein n=1 Tax=Rhodoferax sp. TaxID=50421 RepID=UPI00260C90F9|nr:ABC transporter substrate binding protein [Rhodoferax sp.]MDD2881727.1 ABC transporter substrate binding protein [Rhodoferax sp.]
MVIRLRSLLLSLSLWLLASLSQAEVRVVIVSSDSTAAYMEAAQTLIDGLVNSGVSPYDIRRLSLLEWAARPAQTVAPRIYVALGSQATAALAASKVSAPVLATLLPRSSFERVLRSSGRKASAEFTAVYLDQSLQRQLTMIRLALPQAKHLGVLWGPDSWPKAPALRSLADANGLSLNEAGLEGNFNVFPDLQQVLNGCDVFLALADPLVFNSSSIQNILLTTFRAGVPVVAFSPAYVRAGALLALHATPVQVGRQAATFVVSALRGQLLPEQPVESNDFEVSVNEHVARALGLSLDAKALRLTLRRLEHLP